MPLRRIALAGALGAGLLWPACGSAQVAASAPAARPAASASIGHAFAKATTFNVGIAAVSMTIFMGWPAPHPRRRFCVGIRGEDQ